MIKYLKTAWKNYVVFYLDFRRTLGLLMRNHQRPLARA